MEMEGEIIRGGSATGEQRQSEDEDENDPRCPGFVKQKPVYRFFRI